MHKFKLLNNWPINVPNISQEEKDYANKLFNNSNVWQTNPSFVIPDGNEKILDMATLALEYEAVSYKDSYDFYTVDLLTAYTNSHDSAEQTISNIKTAINDKLSQKSLVLYIAGLLRLKEFFPTDYQQLQQWILEYIDSDHPTLDIPYICTVATKSEYVNSFCKLNGINFNPDITQSRSELTIRQLQHSAHQVAVDHGWWNEPDEFGTLIALAHSELSEALQADRKNVDPDDPHGVPTELADCIIRILDMADYYGWDMQEVLEKKNEVNKHRAFKHGGRKY
ncbi:hypothetical protein ABTQ33_04570 [Paucilactobacillus suebicus]|uniref:MazG nucleotide pyrophosphohydrolase n=1 Tax=Paucilactobacillus suebicus DSM 5007 = KCTC 3549 TaxID=1423807 RepID=A0A0R1VYZ8_9LACO|nr:hypothetical protein [Paucilactobacillus suebicus]KRM10559.1 hypothetical protein FD16_GL001161 [Paucilactobacillus suebicus DSM 5007 = KCTC 3549]